MKRNILDRFFSYVSPELALKRERYRLALTAAQDGVRRFDAASRGRRTASWIAPSTDANSAQGSSLVTLRNRSRDLTRNDGFAQKAVQVLVENVVGTGILAKPQGKATGRVRLASDAWKAWAESTACDFDGNLDFYGLQALIFREIVESGEVLIRKIRTDNADFPLKLQILEADYLDETKSGRLESGGYIVQGVEFSAQGERVAYWLFPSHPGDTLLKSAGMTSKRFPASEIIHRFRQDRAGQVRGVPFGASVFLLLRDVQEWAEIHLIRAKIAACWSLFVYDTEAPVDPTASVGGALPIDKVEPGLIEYLPPGKDIKFATPPGVEGYSEFTRDILHRISSGYGIPFESLTGDFSQINFSSGRMGWIEFQRNIEALRWRVLIPGVCDPVWNWFTEAALLAGLRLEGVKPIWTPPRREMIDPSKEITAQITAIRGGLTTLSEVIRGNGYDPAEVLKERAEDDALLEKLGIALDSDPRKTMKTGSFQTQNPQEQTQ